MAGFDLGNIRSLCQTRELKFYPILNKSIVSEYADASARKYRRLVLLDYSASRPKNYTELKDCWTTDSSESSKSISLLNWPKTLDSASGSESHDINWKIQLMDAHVTCCVVRLHF